jgi:hypothetical protein
VLQRLAKEVECSGGEEGEDRVRVPKMVWEKCALHEKRVRVQFFSIRDLTGDCVLMSLMLDVMHSHTGCRALLNITICNLNAVLSSYFGKLSVEELRRLRSRGTEFLSGNGLPPVISSVHCVIY